MPKIKYDIFNFTKKTLAVIGQANEIIVEYQAQGFSLTLRQIYYQFVSRDLIPNRQNEYNKLGNVLNNGRLAGLIDWNAIEDRTRFVRSLSHWNNPSQIIDACADQYRVDRWEDQKYRLEVWIEKDALTGIIEGICEEHDIPYFSCRGYVSQSEVWRAAIRLNGYFGQDTRIIHLGDHDPSGIDMTRDIQDRLRLFKCSADVERIALNMDQVEQYSPPPNPAKLTDSRCEGYIAEYGSDSWELDALEPSVIVDLIRSKIEGYKDQDKWEESEDREEEGREKLAEVSRTLREE
ncbi:MAG: hypothetical protein KAU20_02275 [Nanoarchaeota archaeon]|nr:hypothetical protein [Nanoarchaeota archaeon]